MAKKAKRAVAGNAAANPPPGYPIFIDVPGRPDQVERCDWDVANNEPSCVIIQRTPPKNVRVRPAGQVAGIHRRHRA